MRSSSALLWVFFLLVSSHQAMALVRPVRLRLVIRDQESGGPQTSSAAQVMHHGHVHTHSADKNGLISFELEPDSINCWVIAAGYRSVNLKFLLRRDTTIKVDLIKSNFTTSEVDITAKYDRQLADVTSRIDKEAISLKQGRTLGEVLEQVSGVNVIKTGSTIVKPVIHGLSGQRIILMNASVKQEGQQWGSEHAPEIDPMLADSITVVKGAQSVRYGPDALGGVVLIEPKAIIKQDALTGHFATAAASNGRMGSFAGGINFAKYIGQVNLFARGTGHLKQAGDLNTPNYNLVNTGVREQNFSMLAGLNYKSLSVEGFYSQFNTTLGIFQGAHIGNLTDLANALQRSQPAIVGPFSYNINRPRQQVQHETARLKLTFDLSDKHQLRFDISRQFNDRREFDILRTQADNQSDRSQLNYRLTTLQGNLVHKGYWGKVQTTSGLSYSNQANTWDGRFLIPNYVANGLGGYTIASYKSFKTTYEAGIRLDNRLMTAYFNNGGVVSSVPRSWTDWSANAGIRHELTDHLTVLANIGQAWRPPTVNELFSNGLHHGAAAIERGNQNLEAERSTKLTTELLFSWPEISGSITLYGQHFSNFIYMIPQLPAEQTVRGAFPVFGFTQVPARFLGFDFEVKTKSNGRLNHTLSGSYVNARRSDNNSGILFIPPARLRYLFDIKLVSQSIHHLHLQAGMTAVAQQSDAPNDQDYAPAPAGYLLLDIALLYKYSTQQGPITAQIRIDNALNTVYRDYLNRFRYYADEPGLNVTATLFVPLTLSKI